jgi:hypothetical protein
MRANLLPLKSGLLLPFGQSTTLHSHSTTFRSGSLTAIKRFQNLADFSQIEFLWDASKIQLLLIAMLNPIAIVIDNPAQTGAFPISL